MKEFLSHARADFIVRNVDEDDAAYRELVARGFRTVPVTIIGRDAVIGFDPDRLRAALNSHP